KTPAARQATRHAGSLHLERAEHVPAAEASARIARVGRGKPRVVSAAARYTAGERDAIARRRQRTRPACLESTGHVGHHGAGVEVRAGRESSRDEAKAHATSGVSSAKPVLRATTSMLRPWRSTATRTGEEPPEASRFLNFAPLPPTVQPAAGSAIDTDPSLGDRSSSVAPVTDG